MSAYTKLMSPMIDQECLISALGDLGFGAEKLEVHDTPVSLQGYGGDLRPERANVLIRKKHVGHASNDIGFLATPFGFVAHISQFDRQNYSEQWLGSLHAAYQTRLAAKLERIAAEERQRLEEERQRVVEAQRLAVHARAKKMGYQVQEAREGDKIRLMLVKRTY